MGKSVKKILYFVLMIIVILPCLFLFTGCSSKWIVSFEKTGSDGLVDTYTIKYSDGSKETFTVTNGTNGNNGENGVNGKDGKDGTNVTIEEIYTKYVEEYGEITYEEFLKKFLSFGNPDNRFVINKCLQSVMKVHCEFKVSTSSYINTNKDILISSGSAVIFEVFSDYTYIVTNYHVVFNSDANVDNGGKIASKITGYLYGSEGNFAKTSDKDNNGYPIVEYYEDYAISLEYVGGALSYDIAVIRAKTEDIKKVNPNISPVTLAEDYYVGESAIAIGNTENEGISVTEGIVSVDNEEIILDIDGSERYYRSLRIDTAIYSGNSGGGLFNNKGELIGITNAGDGQDQNVNYAIPIEIVRAMYSNIMYYYNDSNVFTINSYKIKLGITVLASNTKYTYNKETGYGKITQDIVVTAVEENSLAESWGISINDKLLSVIINDKEYIADRNFDIGDAILDIVLGDTVKIKYLRNDETYITDAYVIKDTNLIAIE